MLPLKEKVSPQHTALIVVDVQNDYCHSQGALGKRALSMSQIQSMVPNLTAFIAKARAKDVPVIFARTSHGYWSNSAAWIERMKDVTVAEVPICQENSWGAEFYLVEPQPVDKIVVKHRYSAFYGTDLDVALRARGIRTLLMTGVATNVCVESTARDGYQRDYHIVFVSDCCATVSDEDHQATLRNISNFFGVVADSNEVAEAWS